MLPMPKLKSLKKGQSGTRSGLLGKPDPGLDTRNFPIEKKHRFANRFFQAVCAFASYYFLQQQDSTLISDHGLFSIMNFNWFVAIVAPIAAACLVGQYFITFIITAWNSRKILCLELLCDCSASILFIVCFIAEISKVKTNCAPGTSSACDRFNWVLAWNFLSFIFWTVAIGFDIHSLLIGLGFISSYGQRIEDLEMDAEIRRLGRS